MFLKHFLIQLCWFFLLAELILTTRNLYGGVSIQGKHSKAFLCMSRAGRVILQVISPLKVIFAGGTMQNK
jgi:hypothetical protein